MLIQGSLQLSPGIFSIFYHSALAKKSAKKADDLSLSFILGVETFLTAMLLFIFQIVNFLLLILIDPAVFYWTFAGIFFAEAIIVFCVYFRKSPATTLFIPRRIARNYQTYAASAKTRRDTFLLGFFSGIPELIFTFPLFILLAFITSFTPELSSSLSFIPYIIIAVVPLFTIRTLFRSGLNLASITRLRTKFKPLIRLILALSYLFIAICLIYLGVTNG